MIVVYHSYKVPHLVFFGRGLHVKYCLNHFRIGFDPILGYNVAEILNLRLYEVALVYLSFEPSIM